MSAKIDQLSHVVMETDCIAHEAFSAISALAKLALASLETPAGCIDSEGIAYALNAIHGKALDAENGINSMASEVGCNYVNHDHDQAMGRRFAARRFQCAGATA